MSLRKIAREIGISAAYLSYMVNGKRPWRTDLYQRYCHLVNTSVNTPQNRQLQVPIDNHGVQCGEGETRTPTPFGT